MEGVIVVDRFLFLLSVLKNNLLYGNMSLEEVMEERKKNFLWIIEDYDKRFLYTNFFGYLKVCKVKN